MKILRDFSSNLSWRTRRQLMYLAIPIIPVLLFGGYLILDHYTTASCNDGRLNQGELGIDCEGPCPQICQARIEQPEIKWSRAYQVQPGIYNMVALIANKNEDLVVANTEVNFEARTEAGEVVYQDSTTISLRPSAETVAFIGPVEIDPAPTDLFVTFNLTPASWRRADVSELTLDPLVVSREIEGTKTEPRVVTEIRNPSRDTIVNMPVAVVVRDENGNPVAASNTFTDLEPQGVTSLTYTWPRAFPTTSGVCEQPVDVFVLLDASGSMNSISTNPPEPLTSVKSAAKRFVGLFSSDDRMGIVSFANDADLVQGLTNSINTRVRGIDSIVITPEAENGYTNIAAALELGLVQLQGSSTATRGQAVVLLTDGQPTAPDGASDPEVDAVVAANSLLNQGVELFVIGLGETVNTGFLQLLVGGDQSRVFKTTDVRELSTIYSQVASAVCERSPYVVDVYPSPPLPVDL